VRCNVAACWNFWLSSWSGDEECRWTRCRAESENMAWMRKSCVNERETMDVPQMGDPVMCGPSMD